MSRTISVLAFTVLATGCASTGSSSNDFMGTVSETAKSVGSTVGDVASGFLSGYETGIYVTPEQLDSIKKGVTTESEVFALIGAPSRKEQLGSKEVWNYPYTKIPHFGKNVNETTVIEFNSKGVVVSAYKANGVSGSTGNAMIDAARGVN
ncbi:outer membrane protein assembly factor BamE [Endozoicomonas sp. SESOKO1]|uniref:outer membrane protein assembly factor BamE n=1 Tax=Endozoicomonas sp. SESOKO1 TaxID=2828742 RepID=UPI0021477221|nr:outer membrane protein assembly factor BamE [Endozoicomonas sp. SESOKO1]